MADNTARQLRGYLKARRETIKAQARDRARDVDCYEVRDAHSRSVVCTYGADQYATALLKASVLDHEQGTECRFFVRSVLKVQP